jgi:hypothetical protein
MCTQDKIDNNNLVVVVVTVCAAGGESGLYNQIITLVMQSHKMHKVERAWP